MLITGFWETTQGVPLTAPTSLPEVQVRRSDTQAIVQAFTVMTNIGDGNYAFDFTVVDGLEYTFQLDGDPNSDNTISSSQLLSGSFSGTVETRIETDIPELVDHIVGTAIIDKAIDPTGWVERRFVKAVTPPDTVEEERYELYHQTSIGGSVRITNTFNPTTNPAGSIDERRRI